ncbi:putative 60S ribosomal protein L7 [Blattamonas nauphoetae]|uniref:60S ribosomal protein L7 n=1 Tax=Blattamonas nauphoetae TaxID=2049346 RepID=A0ABQ9Y4Y0_9EUKA|nr:putative 60S ribosomal protein L7 [Blattamonas nauphoetae]
MGSDRADWGFIWSLNSQMASPMTIKRNAQQLSDLKASTEKVEKWLSSVVGRKVAVPNDLLSGVVLCEALNKLNSSAVADFDKAPKNVFAQAENFKKVNSALLKFGVSPSDVPEPISVASGKENARLIHLLAKLSERATTLKVAPESYVKAQTAIALKQQKTRALALKEHDLDRKYRVLNAVRAAKYQREYKHQREKQIRQHRKAEAKSNFFVPAEPKVAFVMRLREDSSTFRLRQIQNATFVRLNKATLNMLKVIEPYVAIGYPSVRSMRALITKRGYAKINGQRIPITTNKLVHYALGKYNIHTVDDLIHELYTCGRYFPVCNRFLWPFKMNSPRGGYGKSKLTHFAEGGSAGNRMGMINKLIRQCL